MLIIAAGQEYDGATNMSSEAVGVQRIIKNNSFEKSVHTHCCGHNLALVICTTCKPVMIRNALDTVRDTCMMFVRGLKKMSLLRDVFKENPHFSEQFLISVSLDGSKTSIVTTCFYSFTRLLCRLSKLWH